MNKKLFFAKSFAVVLGTLLYTSCTNTDNPVAPEEYDPIIEEVTYQDLTSRVGISQGDWHAGGVCATTFAPAITTADGRTSNMMEKYETTVETTGTIMYQTIEGLENGSYTVEIYANAFFTNGRGFESPMEDGAKDVAYVYANDQKAYLTCNITTATTANGVYGFDVDVTDGTLTLGLAKDKAGTNWHTIQIKSLALKVVNVRHISEAYAEVLPEAEELAQKAMPAEAKAALLAALDEEVMSTENLEALKEAVKAAKEGAQSYEQFGTMLDAMKELVDGTNVYTEEALTDYYTKYAEKYLAGTLTPAEGGALQNPSLVTGWHANITCDNFLLSAWDTNPDFQNAPYYINTWSTEGDNDGSNFRVPFFEYWTGDGDSLGERTLTATMNGLAAGNYEVSAWVRVRAKNGYEAPAYGISLQANDGTPVNVAAGAQVGTSQFFLDNFTATGTVGANGVLKIKFIVAADNNISWLSFKNVKFQKK